MDLYSDPKCFGPAASEIIFPGSVPKPRIFMTKNQFMLCHAKSSELAPQNRCVVSERKLVKT
jgi:hypothetical protein